MIKKIFLPLLLLLVGSAYAQDTRVCCCPPPPTPSTPTIPVVLFADLTNFDDTLALFLLLKDTRVDLKAIYIDGDGFADPGATIQYVYNILDWMGRTTVPVVVGSFYSSIDRNAPPGGPRDETWRAAVPKGSNGVVLVDSLFGVANLLPQSPRHYQPKPAAGTGFEDDIAAIELIRGIIAASSAPVNILTLGPATGIQQVLLGATFPAFPAPIFIPPAGADVVNNIASFWFSGGDLGVPGGNVLFFFDEICRSEFNAFSDPQALQDVFTALANAGIPINMVPLDATTDVPAKPFIDTINATPALTPEFVFIRRFVNAVAENWFSFPVLNGLFIWDMSVTAAFLNSDVIVSQGNQDITVIVDTTLVKLVNGAPPSFDCSAFNPANTCPIENPCEIQICRTYTANTGRTIVDNVSGNTMNVITDLDPAAVDAFAINLFNTRNANSARVPLQQPLGLYRYAPAV